MDIKPVLISFADLKSQGIDKNVNLANSRRCGCVSFNIIIISRIQKYNWNDNIELNNTSCMLFVN